MRRVVVDEPVASSHAGSRVVHGPSAASVVVSILTVLYVAAVAVIGLDTLLEALDARESNALVSAIDAVASVLVAPFRGIFDGQQFWATALIAAVAYTIVYLVAMAVLRRDRRI